MGGLLNNEAAEREADRIALKFQNSNDVIRDMGRAYNTDFSDIRIHTDESADAKVKSAGRDAIASGRDIFFGKGLYESKEPERNVLVAHELAHTMQQGAVDSSGAVSEAAPMGAQQGGLFKRIKNWFHRRKNRRKLRNGGSLLSNEDKQGVIQNLKSSNGSDGEKFDASKLKNNTTAAPSATTSSPVDTAQWDNVRKFAMPKTIDPEAIKQTDYDAMSNNFGRMIAESNGATDKLTGLGLRDIGSPQALTHKAIKDKIFDIDDYEGYIQGLNTGGFDYKAINGASQEWMDPIKSRVMKAGKEVTDVGADLMTIMGNKLKTDEGIKYLSFMTNGMANADVFKNSGETPLNYMLNTIFTEENLKIRQANGNVDNATGTKDIERGKFIQEVIKNVQILPAIDRMPKEQREALPPTIKALHAKYLQLQNELQQKIDEMKSGQ